MNRTEMEKKRVSAVSVPELHPHDLKPTSFFDTLTNMVKAYIGCGILALGMAFKNGGLVFSVIALTFLGFISCYNQHILVQIATYSKCKYNFPTISFSDTIGVAFKEGPGIFRDSAGIVRWMIKIYIVLFQHGVCCTYFLFLSQSLKQLCACYDIVISVHHLMFYVLLVILAVAMIRELKYIAPLSTIANLSALAALSLILYNSVTGLGQISDRKFIGKLDEILLAFGTMVFSLEGITVTLPFQQSMNKKEQFLGTFGVLNISLTFVIIIMQVVGFFGYYRFGEDVKESLTFNLDIKSSIMARGVIFLMMIGILSSYALQFFILVIQFLPVVKKKTVRLPFYSYHLYEYLLRIALVLLAFLTAQMVPHLDLVISLVGSVAGSALSFIFAPLADVALRKRNEYGIFYWRMGVNIMSMVIAVFGCVLGTTISIRKIIIAIKNDHLGSV